MHQTISPAILYWGTPVLIIPTTNEDGTTNLAPHVLSLMAPSAVYVLVLPIPNYQRPAAH